MPSATPEPAVQAHFVDAWGRRRRADPDTVRLLREAVGLGRSGRAPAGRATGGPAATRRALTCHVPEEARTWGWSAQLYAVRSRASWGIGDLADLRRLGSWSQRLGAGFIQLNPLHAGAPAGPQQASPYFPSSRRFRSPLYIAVEEVPGHRRAANVVGKLAAAARGLNQDRLIRRDEVHAFKSRALEAIWDTGPPVRGLDAYLRDGGPALLEYGLYCALAERHGADWRAWPAGLRHPRSAAARRAAAELDGRVRFHAWLQWLLDRQLERAAAHARPLCDLAIGADPGGADSWAWSDELLPGFTVGAPPDGLNAQGQDWGFPAFNPSALATRGYGPFREVVRANLRHAFGLRLDHVMGLFRLWMIPHGAPATSGAYLTFPAAPLLDVIAEESRAAGALIVGEDLGTVQPEVRVELRRRRILSYRVLWFESRPPRAYPRLSLSAVTTHDLPTAAGLWTGDDARQLREAGIDPGDGGRDGLVARLAEWCGIPSSAPPGIAVPELYRLLAGSPSRLLAATLEDALLIAERPNVPGTVWERPNWSLALPGGLEGLRRSETAARLASVLSTP